MHGVCPCVTGTAARTDRGPDSTKGRTTDAVRPFVLSVRKCQEVCGQLPRYSAIVRLAAGSGQRNCS